ncbi:sodium channel, voltage-gated, type I, beta a [Centroberyx affinis]|uniref:sodium channel, voltage-gated, type I, beta a n=1 Tax=Centroberyx affinis TaxID=166261 RepID=UPI003A5BC82C
MSVVRTLLLLPLGLLALQASLCHAACVEVDSDTEAVVDRGFKLGCIYCKMRGEVQATAWVDWWFKAKDDVEYTKIYTYENQKWKVLDWRFQGRLYWNGSKNTADLLDGSIYIVNMTYNDTGIYNCSFYRKLTFSNSNFEFESHIIKNITINVVPGTTRGMASILSEVMMYVTIIGLQFWLVVEMVYCYRKIAAAGEEALRESAAEYLAIASESKDNCAGVQVAE